MEIFHRAVSLKSIAMETSNILTADVLDIIFEGRNKSYGAYELRKTYNKRLAKALLAMGILLALVFISVLISNFVNANSSNKPLMVNDVQLEKITPEEKKAEPILPPPKQEPPKVETAKFASLKIVKDDDVKEDDKPPEQDKLDDTKIGTANVEGIKDDGIPPVNDNKGIVEAPKKDDEDNGGRPFERVEIESEYPGGLGAWMRYLQKNLQYPPAAVDNEVQGTVTVQFVVDKEGAISDVEAISGPDELKAEAIRVIKKSGKWTAAIQNGRQVKSYKRQPITFKLASD